MRRFDKRGKSMKRNQYNRTLPVFYLLKENLEQFGNYLPPGHTHVFLSTASGGIKLAIRALKWSSQDEILLPSYLCPSILRPLREEGVNYKFFKVKEDLAVDIEDVKERISDNTKALFIIHYFGFPQPIEEIVELCKDEHLVLIEDCAQAFLSKYNDKLLGSFGDFSIFSYRKTLPVPDGALLACNNPSITSLKVEKRTDFIHLLYSIMETNVLLLTDIFAHFNFIFPIPLLGGMSHLNKKLMTIYYKPTSPSYISQLLLHKFNFEEIISIKRNNFKYMLEHLNIRDMKPLYSELPEGVCPLWFPILTENRDNVRKWLKRRGISTPVFWKLPPEIDKTEFRESWEISGQILSIPLGSIRPINMPSIIEILSELSKSYERKKN